MTVSNKNISSGFNDASAIERMEAHQRTMGLDGIKSDFTGTQPKLKEAEKETDFTLQNKGGFTFG